MLHLFNKKDSVDSNIEKDYYKFSILIYFQI